MHILYVPPKLHLVLFHRRTLMGIAHHCPAHSPVKSSCVKKDLNVCRSVVKVEGLRELYVCAVVLIVVQNPQGQLIVPSQQLDQRRLTALSLECLVYVLMRVFDCKETDV